LLLIVAPAAKQLAKKMKQLIGDCTHEIDPSRLEFAADAPFDYRREC